MIDGTRLTGTPIRWGMIGGGQGSQIGYIHRSAALRDSSFRLLAGAFDIDAARGKDFGTNIGVAPERCYADYKTMFVNVQHPGEEGDSHFPNNSPRPRSSVLMTWLSSASASVAMSSAVESGPGLMNSTRRCSSVRLSCLAGGRAG